MSRKTLLAAAAVAAVRTAMPDGALTRDGEEPPEQIIYRDIAFEVREVDEERRTVELSFSSELPVERWWGTEILDHGASAVRLGRLNNGGALLMDHDRRDVVGVVEKAWVKGRVGRAIVRFGQSARAKEIFQDVVDRIRTLVSVGYFPHKVVLEKTEEERSTYRLMDWEPFEISLVSVPADTTVGVGRDGETPAFDPRTLVEEEEDDMQRFRNAGGGSAPTAIETPAPAPVENRSIPAAPVSITADQRAAIANEERDRISAIRVLGLRMNAGDAAEAAIAGNHSVDQFVRTLNGLQPDATAIRTAEAPMIGLTERENQRYSFVRMLHALANPTDQRAQDAAGFEFECSAAARAARPGAEFQGNVTVPADVLRAALSPEMAGMMRDLSVGTPTAGGHMVATNLLASSFIEMLRNRMVVNRLGARTLADLNGNLAIPRMTGGATAYWVAEGAAVTESQQAFDQVALTPKTLGAFTDVTRKLLLQSSVDVEALIRLDLTTCLGLEIDRVSIAGSGSAGQPRGILSTSGIGSVIGGTNGADPDWTDIVDLETEVAADNADIGSLAYLTNSKVRGKLKKTQRFSGTDGKAIWDDDNRLNGYSAEVSNQVPANLTKGTSVGVASALLFGNWADLLIGLWGGLDLLVDPYTHSTTGTVRIVALQDVDVAVRHAESFSAMVDALTV